MKHISQYILDAMEWQPSYAQIFIIIKPGFQQYGQAIIERFAKDGWVIEKQRTKRLLESEARRLYTTHRDKDFYKPLCKYMSSDVTTAFILCNKDKKMSPKVFKDVSVIKDEIRDEYGESDMRNVIHSSDSAEHMKEEQSIYF